MHEFNSHGPFPQYCGSIDYWLTIECYTNIGVRVGGHGGGSLTFTNLSLTVYTAEAASRICVSKGYMDSICGREDTIHHIVPLGLAVLGSR